MARKIYLYDTTLRDGAQTQGLDFSLLDKIEISEKLDELGIDYIEGGFPGANKIDDEYFANLPKTKNSKITAFGMTHKHGISAENDPRLNAIVNSGVKHACIFGKSWDFHVREALQISLPENIKLVSSSVEYLVRKGLEVTFDAEHFFDGYKNNPEYALDVIKTAYDSGARWISLCDTNGGILPNEITEIVTEVTAHIARENIAIHCHNDTENAVANSIAAVMAGACQVQGTVNGWGERCGNTNLIALIPTLKYKLGFEIGVSDKKMKDLTKFSSWFDNKLGKEHYSHAAYVGVSAFAHKGGVHGSAVEKNAKLYEHIEPEVVGNERQIVVSNQAGRANILNRLCEVGFKFDIKKDSDKKKISNLLSVIKEKDKQGYAYDHADASFEILARRCFDKVPEFYRLKSFRVIDERRWDAKGKLVTFSEAKVKAQIDDQEYMEVAEGKGPVDALYSALIKILSQKYKKLKNMHLVDYKVRIIAPEKATAAITRVEIKMHDARARKKGKKYFTTVGASQNIIDASYNALADAFNYKLMK